MRYVLLIQTNRNMIEGYKNRLRAECKKQGVGVLIALMANNDEAQRFYKSVEDASIHDTGIWIDIHSHPQKTNLPN